MSNIDLKHLFTPGAGAIPPYLAGRKREQEHFRDCVEALIARKPISQNMIVYGPRGNGKTAMLRYLQKETLKETGNRLEILWVTPSEFEDLGELVDLIVNNDQGMAKKARNLFRPLFDNLSASANIGVASVKTALSRPRATLAFKGLLQEKSKKKPLILIVDEAHTLDPKIGKVLLNASQNVRAVDCPFLLVLAGTPNLRAALARATASFWERSKKFPLGRLSPEEAQQAITAPLNEMSVTVSKGTAEEVADRAHCYPFFIQLWGRCLAHRLAQTGETEITLDAVKEVDATVVDERDSMYQDRLDEIDRMGLRPAAERVAEAFIQTSARYLHRNTLKSAIRKEVTGDEEAIHEKLDQLMQLGYVWGIGEDQYEPGIPSLMNFVRRCSHHD